MAARAAYPSDLTDQQFAVIEPLLPARKSGTPNGGRPPLPWREIVNSILYILRTGAAWRQMPHDLVHWKTAHHYLRTWSKDGTWAAIHDELRRRVRQAEGRQECPSAAIIDSQSSKTTLKGGIHAATTRGKRSKAPSDICSSTPLDSCSR